jgi:hypothetical protein
MHQTGSDPFWCAVRAAEILTAPATAAIVAVRDEKGSDPV